MKDTSDYHTNYCTHENNSPIGVCDKCMTNKDTLKKEINSKESGIVDLVTGIESDFCAYEIERKNDLCGKKQYKGGFCKRHYHKLYGY